MARSKVINEVPFDLLCKRCQRGPKGHTLTLKIKPQAAREILVLAGDELCLSVRALAVDNAANERVLDILAEIFNVPKSTLEIISGHKSRLKKILLTKFEF